MGTGVGMGMGPVWGRGLGWMLLALCLSVPRLLVVLPQPEATTAMVAWHLLGTALLALVLVCVRELVALASSLFATVVFVLCFQLMLVLAELEAVLLESFGFGFNSLTFLHAAPEALEPALLDYTVPLAIGLGTIALVSWGLVSFYRRVPALPLSKSQVAVGALLVGLGAAGALQALESANRDLAVYSFVRASREYERPIPRDLDLEPAEIALLKGLGFELDEAYRRPRLARLPERRPNLLFILLESFQDNFTSFDDSPFPKLTPNLDRIASRMTHASNSFNAVTPSIRAITSLNCGTVPHQPPSYQYINEYRSVTCLSDLLHEAGYYQVFMGSSSRKFTNKDYFLTSHRFDEVYGNEDFEAKYKFFHTNSWGIDDPHLVKEALDKIDEIRENGPFSLMMLTMNTHKPGYPSPYCPSYRKGNRYLEAIHCTDFAMGKFFEGIEERGLFEDTVIVLVGDHMAFPNAHTQRDLGPEVASRYYGNVFLAFHSPVVELPDQIDTFNYTPDIAPTILDLMGFELEAPFQFGKSILGERPSYTHLVGPDMEVFEGELYPKKRKVLAKEHCNELRLQSIRITDVDRNLEACERMRIVSRVDRWLQTAEQDPSEASESMVDTNRPRPAAP